MSNFNFKEWRELYKTDPVAFERKRKEALQGIIDRAPDDIKPHLQSFMFRTELELDRCKNPIIRYNTSQRLMWEGVQNLVDECLNDEEKSRCDVIKFPKK